MKFRKKSVVIDAWKVRRLIDTANDYWHYLPTCIVEAYDKGDLIFLSDAITIKTLEGIHRAEIDDWVIRGVKGELYPCKPDIFDMTYEEER